MKKKTVKNNSKAVAAAMILHFAREARAPKTGRDKKRLAELVKIYATI